LGVFVNRLKLTGYMMHEQV